MAKPFPSEFRERALRLVDDRLRADPDVRVSSVAREIAPRLGISPGTLERWWHKANPGPIKKAVVSEDVLAENKRLKREIAELRRANEILKLASAFFAAELDRPGTK